MCNKTQKDIKWFVWRERVREQPCSSYECHLTHGAVFGLFNRNFLTIWLSWSKTQNLIMCSDEVNIFKISNVTALTAWPLPIVKLRSRSSSRSGRSDLDLSSTLFLVFTRAWLPLMPLKSWALSSFEYFSKSRVICCLDFSLNWGSREYLLSFTRLTMWFPSFFYINCLRLWRDDRMLKLTVTEPDELVDVLNIL